MTLISFFSIKSIENTILWKLMVLSTKCKLELGVSHKKCFGVKPHHIPGIMFPELPVLIN